MSYTNFYIAGPYEVPVEKGPRGVYIKNGCYGFWGDKLREEVYYERGCYVFAIRASRGFVPIYVGRATKTFGQECFQSHKVAAHYNPALMNRQRGTPVIFFVVAERKRGRANSKSIKDLETWLIQEARFKNPNLSNKQNNKDWSWGIDGVAGGRQGKPSKAAVSFKKAIGL